MSRVVLLSSLVIISMMLFGCGSDGALDEGVGSIMGVVREGAGGSEVQAKVHLAGDLSSYTLTDGAGLFALHEIPAGVHTVYAWTVDGLSGASEVTVYGDKTSETTIVLSPAGRIVGEVALEGEEEAGGVKVQAEGTIFVAVTEASGAYALYNLPPGCVALTFEKEGYGTETIPEICVGEGEIVTAPKVTMKKGPSLGCSLDSDCPPTMLCQGGACELKEGLVPEACNGEDDDGDGMVDEGLVVVEGNSLGVCSPSLSVCLGGSMECIQEQEGPAAEEVCTNGLDDDCDGLTDEECPCLEDGQPCEDGDLCTVDDECVAGECVPGSAVTCEALDQCHELGVCDPATGACSDPAKDDGEPCDDGSLCTQTDSCQAGVCTGSDQVVCEALDQCHGVGTCEPETGTCDDPVVDDDTPCEDGDLCTEEDVCKDGVCEPGTPVLCAPESQCHEIGVCEPSTGACSPVAKEDDSPCDDGDKCTLSDTCLSGVCQAGEAVVCEALDQCHTVGTCDPATGSCSEPTEEEGTPCDDGESCTQGDACQSGVCTGEEVFACGVGASCTSDEECIEDQVCLAVMPGGYCTYVGCDTTPCPEGAACLDDGFGTMVCMLGCQSGDECRQELSYECTGDGVCWCGAAECEPGAFFCEGTTLTQCNPCGSGLEEPVSCADEGKLCTLDGCKKKPCKALSFDGATTKVTFGDVAELSISGTNAPVSLEAWVRFDEAKSTIFIHKGLSPTYEYAFAMDGEGNVGFMVNDAGAYAEVETLYPDDGAWHHLAGVYDGTSLELFLDGQESASVPHSGVVVADATPLEMGTYGLDDTDQYHGLMTEVRLWSRPLGQEEIMEHRFGVVDTATAEGLVAYWPMAAGEGDVLEDLSTNNITGTITDGSWESTCPRLCEPDTHVCNGDIATWCNENGDGYLAEGEDCSLDGAECMLGVCQPWPCRALHFDGLENMVSFPDAPELDIFGPGTVLTIEAWVKAEKIEQTLFVQKGAVSVFQYSLWLEENGDLTFRTNDAGVKIDVRTPFPNDGAWHHIAGVMDGSSITLYLDGKAMAWKPHSGDVHHGDEVLTFGGVDYEPAYTLNGSLDEVRLWSKPLSAEELNVGMFVRVDPSTADGLVGYWPLDGTSDTLVADLGVHGLDGTISGAVWQQDCSRLCTPWEPACDGDMVVACEGTGYSFGSVLNDCTQQMESCKEGACKPAPCKSLLLDGDGDFVKIPHAEALSLVGTSYTAEVWAKPYDLGVSNLYSLLAKYTGEAGEGLGWRLLTTGLPSSTGAGALTFGTYFGDGTLTSTTTDPGLLEADTWSHVAVTYYAGAGEATLWINGEPILTEAVDEPPATDVDLHIGSLRQAPCDTCFYWDGLVDEVRISSEVRYSSPFTPATRFVPDGATVGLWHLDSEEGPLAEDSSGNHNDGVVTGGQWVNECPLGEWVTLLDEDFDDGVADGFQLKNGCAGYGCPEVVDGHYYMAGDWNYFWTEALPTEGATWDALEFTLYRDDGFGFLIVQQFPSIRHVYNWGQGLVDSIYDAPMNESLPAPFLAAPGIDYYRIERNITEGICYTYRNDVLLGILPCSTSIESEYYFIVDAIDIAVVCGGYIDDLKIQVKF